MKILVISTSTNETTKYAEGLKRFGSVDLLTYDQLGYSESLMLAKAKEHAPDFVAYIGQRWGQTPSIAVLSKINASVAPMVHICSDAADPPWWDLLQEYHYAGCFSLQVAIDGSRKWPLSDSQMTALTPVDPNDFPQLVAHTERPVVCGYAGNAGSGPGSRRTALLGQLLESKSIDLKIRSNLPYTYSAYCDYLARCRMSLNIAYSGTENAMQVKGRVVESGLAGCCLLEPAGSPTSDWFRPGVEYLTYTDSVDARRIINMLGSDPGATKLCGDRLRARVLAEHTPEHFWRRIFDRIGLKAAA